MRLKFTQHPSDYLPRIQHPDLSRVEDVPDSADSIADSIILLKDENDRLRKMAVSLSVEAEDIRRSLSPTKSTTLLA
ncbi:hypothetical protein NB311A_03684 [Nitrobacter sp. Nb-311A]|uniref:hypothetical protein n=1 Tax=Nitrobacter sp. TaxID=29420 RepID=UPI0000686330|nr:hypothetical protein [Nitrobacter sp.]EAQ37378.1 hypothetical protein NB311A_03684 [Nitrobacter sp. Nb-311A]MCB1392514.1 hypothetical protein [Nitrobacter sp.]MCV0385287.1 hypothetical protein [Nitrobacter sp.]